MLVITLSVSGGNMFYICHDETGLSPVIWELDDTAFAMLLTLMYQEYDEENDEAVEGLLDGIADTGIYMSAEDFRNKRKMISDFCQQGYTYNLIEEGLVSYGTTLEGVKVGLRCAVLKSYNVPINW
jgi:hypothetical protein